jgi:hypothetical protein
MTRIGIHQPNFLPYAGFFKKVLLSDILVILDNVQYSKNGFINRNRIKTPSGPLWITVPVKTSGKFQQPINEVEISEIVDWRRKHLHTLEQNYKKAPFFNEVFQILSRIYENKTNSLSEMNINFIKAICEYLDIKPQFEIASKIQTEGVSTARLVEICQHFMGDIYIYGKGGDNYMNFYEFRDAGIQLELCEYANPEYPQLGADFEPNLSIVDMLFNVGKEAEKIIQQDQG